MTASSKSVVDPSVPPLKPYFDINGSQDESPGLKEMMKKMGLQPHPEGGYFVETDRDQLRVPNPFSSNQDSSNILVDSRSASTTIFYLLTPKSNFGAFHRNKGRTVHTLHKGRGRYVLIHADEVADSSCPGGYGDETLPESQRWNGKKARIETFIVGQNVMAGERLQWIVDGGKYKCSFLLDEEGSGTSEGLLISETVVPGFEYTDHDFMKPERMEALVTKEQAEEMSWMLRKA